MTNDIANMNTKLAIISNDVKYIKKALNGNGEPGLIKDTRSNTNFRIAQESRSKMIQLMFGSGWLLAILTIILNIMGII